IFTRGLRLHLWQTTIATPAQASRLHSLQHSGVRPLTSIAHADYFKMHCTQPDGLSAPCNGADDEERFPSRGNLVRQRGVQLLMRKVFPAGEESQEGPAFLRDVIAYRSAQHRVAAFERVEYRALRNLTFDIETYLPADVREPAKVRRKLDSYHGSVCTSTESTLGKSRTMGAHVSPASADAYTCPPVVPKYTPHLSSESTAIASRSTLT